MNAKISVLLFVLKQSYICYYITYMTTFKLSTHNSEVATRNS